MWGWGATSIGLPDANVRGPYESRKHQGPTRRRWLRGRRRRMGRPPTSVSRPGSTSRVGAGAGSPTHSSAVAVGAWLLICENYRAPWPPIPSPSASSTVRRSRDRCSWRASASRRSGRSSAWSRCRRNGRGPPSWDCGAAWKVRAGDLVALLGATQGRARDLSPRHAAPRHRQGLRWRCARRSSRRWRALCAILRDRAKRLDHGPVARGRGKVLAKAPGTFEELRELRSRRAEGGRARHGLRRADDAAPRAGPGRT